MGDGEAQSSSGRIPLCCQGKQGMWSLQCLPLGLLQDEHAWNTSPRKCLGGILATCPYDFSWLLQIWKSRRPPLWAISGWLSSSPYLYAWTQPPYRRILVICICRLVILVPTNSQLPRPALMHSATWVTLVEGVGEHHCLLLEKIRLTSLHSFKVMAVADDVVLATADVILRL